jgi:hypothetical protein
MMARKWSRQRYSDRYKLTSGEWEIIAVALGHDATRSYYVVKQNGKIVDECDRLSDAKGVVNLYDLEQLA